MSYRSYRIIELVIIAVLVGLTTFAVNEGIAWIPLPAAVVAVFVLLMLRRRIREVISDERNTSITNMPAGFTFQAGTIIIAFTGSTFGALSKSCSWLEPYAAALIFCSGGLLAIYILSTLYYSGKFGGGGVER